MGFLWISGMGILFRLIWILWPRTLLDAQLFVDLGLGRIRGLKSIQRLEIVIGRRHHHPIQSLLQNDNIRIGRKK